MLFKKRVLVLFCLFMISSVYAEESEQNINWNKEIVVAKEKRIKFEESWKLRWENEKKKWKDSWKLLEEKIKERRLLQKLCKEEAFIKFSSKVQRERFKKCYLTKEKKIYLQEKQRLDYLELKNKFFRKENRGIKKELLEKKKWKKKKAKKKKFLQMKMKQERKILESKIALSLEKAKSKDEKQNRDKIVEVESHS